MRARTGGKGGKQTGEMWTVMASQYVDDAFLFVESQEKLQERLSEFFKMYVVFTLPQCEKQSSVFVGIGTAELGRYQW